MKSIIFLFTFLILTDLTKISVAGVSDSISDKFTKADTVRGSLLPERSWWDVLRYEITVKPEYNLKTISGINDIRYRVKSNDHPGIMQIDLQTPMVIDSVILNSSISLNFKSDGNAWYLAVPEQEQYSENSVMIYFHGKPREAVRAPWDGGWVWSKDSLSNPWMSVACQGLGASVWYPCKDHQSEEPDNGASLTMVVDDSLVGVSNGRLRSVTINGDNTTSYKWEVVNPINSYNLVPYIGRYVNFSESYAGEKGILDVDIWVLNYNLEKAKEHVLPEVKRMLEAFEYWFGPYPFYEDSYKLIDAPFAGMEHQSGIAYGNKYLNGFWGMDLTGTGWGKKFDYMIVHESGHEWFGNNITTNDIADMWVHEGFTAFSETLFTEYWFGKTAADEYIAGVRKNIVNKFPLIGYYGVNTKSESSDIYYKGANLLNNIRKSMNDDAAFRNMLRGLNKEFYHKTVNTEDIEKYINANSGFNYQKVFDQYLRNNKIPELEFYFTDNNRKVNYRYVDGIKGFDLPLTFKNNTDSIKIYPTGEWNSISISSGQSGLFDPGLIMKTYYLRAKETDAQTK